MSHKKSMNKMKVKENPMSDCSTSGKTDVSDCTR